MAKVNHYQSLKEKRKLRVRAGLHGTAERPRVSVFRSNHHMFIQAINDDTGMTLMGAHDRKVAKGTKTERAEQAALLLAELLKKNKITAVCFDRGAYKYHGRVKVVAETLRQQGIQL